MPYNLPDVKLRVGYSEPRDPMLWTYLPPPVIEVADIIGLSEALFVPDRTIAASDSISLSEAVFRDWMPAVLDALFSSDLPYVHKQVLVTDILTAISETPSTPEKIKFVTDLLTALESFHDVWKGKWDEPIERLYQSLRELKAKLSDRNVTVRTRDYVGETG